MSGKRTTCVGATLWATRVGYNYVSSALVARTKVELPRIWLIGPSLFFILRRYLHMDVLFLGKLLDFGFNAAGQQGQLFLVANISARNDVVFAELSVKSRTSPGVQHDSL